MIHSFSQIYLEKIHGKLILLESDRKKGVRLFFLLGLIGFIIVSKAFWKFVVHGMNGTEFILMGFVVYLFLIHKLSFLTYKKKYKERILKIVFDAYLENGFFNPKKFISEGEYVGSFLYQGTYNNYKGEDYAEGLFLGSKVKLSELHVTYQKHTSKRKETKIIFDGLLVICEMKHSFVGTTVVEHDRTEKVFGPWVGRYVQKFARPTELPSVRLESVEFEKRFHVTADDQVEARRVLTPFMQEHLLKMAKRVGHPLGFSMTPNQMSIALFTHKNFFEPPLFRTCVESKSLRDVDLIFRLIREIKGEVEKL